jgi:hypothetical protein
MAQFLNPWKSTKEKKVYYELDKVMVRDGDWGIYREFDNSYITTYKNMAVQNLAGFNERLFHRLVLKKRPLDNTFLYDRVFENIKKAELLL